VFHLIEKAKKKTYAITERDYYDENSALENAIIILLIFY
jgi:hypothetical protein